MADSDSDDAPLVVRAQKGLHGALSKDIKEEEGGQVGKAIKSSAPSVVEPQSTVRKQPAIKKEPAVKKEKVTAGVQPGVSKAPTAGKANAKKADKAPVSVDEEKTIKVNKEFSMPGQTRETPPEVDPLRKFYTSLYVQRPDSDMAKRWCLQYGLLPKEEADKLSGQLKSQKPNARNSPAPKARPVAKPSQGSNRLDKASSKEASRAANSAKPAAKPKLALGQKRPVPERTKTAVQYSDDELSEDDVPLVKKAKVAALPGQSTSVAPAVKGKKDVAFTDGGLDDSDDDTPLMNRAAKA